MTPNRKKANAKANIPILQDVCKELGVSVREMSANCFRLTKSGFETWDLFPGGMRVFKVGFNDCRYSIESVEAFIREKFAPENGNYKHKKETVQKKDGRCNECFFPTPQQELNQYEGSCRDCAGETDN